MPADAKEILALPGIGSYTMGAIASIAFQIPLPAVDGNVLRILTRLYGDDSDILDPRFKKKTEEALVRIMPKDRPGDVNQAMMELGATVCLPNGMPKCESCPWQDRCVARKEERLKENAGAADIILTASEMTALDEALETMEMSDVFGGSKIKKR